MIAILTAESRIFPESGGVLFAVSGGPDSIALLDIAINYFPSLKNRIHVAYIHHGLRKNADKELEFVKKIAKKWNIPFHWKKISVQKTRGKSFEEIARIKRYNALIKIAKKFNCTAIVTAHTSDDKAETIILNLLSGAGLKGLCGILPSTEIEDGILLLRPMLMISRNQILEYIKEKKLKYMIDESNIDTRFRRNFVRHKIFPLFEKINPAFRKNIFRTSRILADDYDYIKSSAEKTLEKHFIFSKGSVKFLRKTFAGLHPCIQRFVVREILARLCGLPHPADFASVESLRNAVISEKQGYIDKYGVLVVYDGMDVIIKKSESKKLKPSPFSVYLNIPGETEIPNLGWTIVTAYRKFQKSFLKNPDRFIARIDAGHIRNNLNVCRPDMNACFVPLGMVAPVRVKKYWKTHKKQITKFVEVPVAVQDGEKIVWIIGGHISSDYAIKKESRVLEIRIKES